MRNLCFDFKIFKSTSVPGVKIISVGNLTVGGSGKTPAVIMLCKLLQANSLITGVLSRGYLRKSKGYQLVSDGKNILQSIENSGDEIYFTSLECKCPAAVSEKRVPGVQNFIKDIELDVVILDDAYQHRWINRNLDILIFDQRFLSKPNNLQRTILPSGQMREPFSAAKRADIIIINRKFSAKTEIQAEDFNYFKNKQVFYGYYEATGIIDLKTEKFYNLTDFVDQKSLVVCGIARPYSFLSVLETNHIDIKNKILFKDHKNYDENNVQLIRKKYYDTNSHSVLTTQKDAVKLSHFTRQLDDIDIYYLKIELKLDNQIEFNRLILQSFNK